MNSADSLFAFFVAFFAIEMFYQVFFFSRFAFLKKNNFSAENKDDHLDWPGVSVVICARNEAENLLEHLPKIFDQAYKNFEVIIVNDCSIDDTEDVLRAFKNKHKNCKIVLLKENDLFIGGKKFALTMGIKAAKNDIILFTDADCVPASENWIESVARSMVKRQSAATEMEIKAGKNPDSKIELAIGYGAYKKEKSLLNALIRFDAFSIGLRSFSFALAGLPYMGVGRNLCYRKSFFFRNKGFASHQHIPYGDDDLFVNETANGNNTAIFDPLKGKTISIPEKTFKDWVKQKKRHLSTSPNYKLFHQVLLGIQPLARIFFIVTFVALIILNYNFGLIAVVFIASMLMQFINFHQSMKRMGESDLLFLAPFLEIILLFIYPAIWFAGVTAKKKSKYW